MNPPFKPQNVLGPLIRKLREKQGWSHAQVAGLFSKSGFQCSEERIVQIENQDEAIADYEVLIFGRIFPGSAPHIAKFFSDAAEKKFGKTGSQEPL